MADLATCVATYAYHLTQAHAFLEGTKRIAAATAEIILDINHVRLRAINDEIMRSVYKGETSYVRTEEQ